MILYNYTPLGIPYSVSMFDTLNYKNSKYVIISMNKNHNSFDSECFSMFYYDNSGLLKYKEFAKRPKELQNENCFVRWHTFAIFNNEIYILFDQSLKVYKYNLNGELIANYPINADFVKSFPAFDESKSYSREYCDNYMQHTGCCFKIIYDKYRKLFYVILINPLNEGRDGGGENAPTNSWSIVIFDEKFDQLKEVLMDSRIYNYTLPKPLITKDGVYFVDIPKEKMEDIFKGNLVLTKFNVEVKDAK